MINIKEVEEYAISQLESLRIEVVPGAAAATVNGKQYGVPYTEYAFSFEPEDWRKAVHSLVLSLEHASEAARNEKAEGERMRTLDGPTKVLAAFRRPITVGKDFDSEGRYFIITRVAFWRG